MNYYPLSLLTHAAHNAIQHPFHNINITQHLYFLGLLTQMKTNENLSLAAKLSSFSSTLVIV